ncbi:MAG TPA: 50S ribosomal protein L3 [Candidatus Omnitrophota bacterium]|nr:50S ribosomal protein L3 [Candidatus Omnitrophota bacterium]
MVGLLGKKIGMSQLFDGDGQQIPVTVLEVGPCYVTALRTKEKNGYLAAQLAYDGVKEKKLTKAELGILRKANVPTLNFLHEIRTDNIANLAIGNEIGADNFEVGDFVDVEGISIGKGFQGVVKRLNYKGGASKGHGSMFGRVPGSIGAQAGGRGCRKKVRKGKGLPGHMGNETICVQNLKVMKVDAENNLLVLRGSVPGFEGRYVIVRSSLKKGKKNTWKVRSGKQESSKETPSETSKSENPQEKTKADS